MYLEPLNQRSPVRSFDAGTAVTFARLIRIIVENGFYLDRQRGSHRIYKRIVDGKVSLVVVACHRESDDIKPGTLASMIRESGLNKKLFR